MTGFPTVAARLACVTAIASAGLLLAACGSSPAPSPTTTVTQTVAPSSGATTPASASPVATASTSPAGPPGCLASDLQASLGVSQGTAGTIYQVVVFTNTSAATCTLYGYPGVSFASGVGGSQIGKAATRSPLVSPALVTLAPGGKADVLLAVEDAGAIPNCQITSVDWLRIYPPNDYGSVYVQYKTQACASTKKSILTVTPVRAGAGSASY